MKSNIFIRCLVLLCIFGINSTILLGQDSLSRYSLTELDSVLKSLRGDRTLIKWIPDIKTAIKRTEKEVGTQDTLYAKMLNHLAHAYAEIPESEQAILYFEQSKKMLETHYPKHRLLAITLQNLALIYRNNGQFEEAKPLFLQALQLQKDNKDDYNRAITLSNVAVLYSMMGQFEKAEPYYLDALDYWKSGTPNPNYAKVLTNLGMLYSLLGENEKAELYYLEYLRVAANVQDETFAKGLSKIGHFYLNKEDLPKAELYYKQALEIQTKQVGGKQSLDYVDIIVSMSSLYEKLRDYEKAKKLLQEALGIQKKLLGEQHHDYAFTLSCLGDVYLAAKDYTKAEATLAQAHNIHRALFGDYCFDCTTDLISLSIVYWNLNEADKAWEYAHQALATNTQLKLGRTFNTAWADSILAADVLNARIVLKTLWQMAFLLEKQKAPKEPQLLIAETALQLLRNTKNSFSGESDKLYCLTCSSEWTSYSLYLLKETKQLDKAFAVAEENKSVLLLDAIRTEKAYHFGGLPETLAQQEEQLQARYTELKAAVAEKRPQTEKDSLRTLLLEVNQQEDALKKQIQKDYPNYFAIKYDQKQTQITAIQALLDAKTALLEYVVTDTRVYIFYLDKNNIHLLEFPCTLDSLKLQIRKLHTTLHNYSLINSNSAQAYQDYTEIAHWFYVNLLAPVLTPSFGGLGEAKGAGLIEHLIIIPDGELGHLPFETFLVEKAAPSFGGLGEAKGGGNGNYSKLHYLVNDYRISYNYSATLWKENLERPKNKNNGQLLGIAANYNIKSDITSQEIRLPAYRNLRKLLNPLPNARLEVEALSKKITGHFAFDNQASEKEFKKIAPNYSIIHLAMHGLLDNKNPILSSLAFTEDSDSVENNFLQAYEISQMRLNADLVVLSACETGFGKFEKGNGTASLARAFMYAGVPALVVSLWEVNDASTSILMQYFYENLQKGQDKAEALRQAKLQYLSKTEGIVAHPAFWSPFVLLGDSRPVEFASSKVWIWWLVGGAGALLVLGLAARAIFAKK